MQLLNKIRDLLKLEPMPLSKRLFRNWKPKLICLGVALLVWLWVEQRYVRESLEWDIDTVLPSEP